MSKPLHLTLFNIVLSFIWGDFVIKTNEKMDGKFGTLHSATFKMESICAEVWSGLKYDLMQLHIFHLNLRQLIK